MSDQSDPADEAHDDGATSALGMATVLAQEAVAIDPGIADDWLRKIAETGGAADDDVDRQKLYQSLGRLNRAALCLSGGGIRSAAFGLGVIQALATHPRPGQEPGPFETAVADDPQSQRIEEAAHTMQAQPLAAHDVQMRQATLAALARKNSVLESSSSLLAQLHYLSTVSGGGYIGSWLSAWRNRATFETVHAELVGRPRGPDAEPHTLGWLRAYSNYLTPTLGALSGDTWAGIAIWLRNFLLNWLIIVPAICTVILILKMVATISIGIADLPPGDPSELVLALLAVVLLGAAFRFTTRNRPTQRGVDMRDKIGLPDGPNQGAFIRRNLVPAILGAGAVIQLGASNSGLRLVNHDSMAKVVAVTAAAGAVVYALSWIVACPNRRGGRDFALWMLSGAIYGALLGTIAYVYSLPPADGNLLFNDLLLPVMFGVPWVLVSQMLAETIFVGLSSYQRGAARAPSGRTARPGSHPRSRTFKVVSQDDSDSDREWLGRAAGWYLVTAIGWFVTTFLIFAGSLVLTSRGYTISAWIAPLGGLSGILTALIGKSPLTGGPGAAAKGQKPLLSAGLLLGIAAPLFAAALLIFLSAGLDALLFDDALVVLLRFPELQIFVPLGWARFAALVIGLVVAGALLHWLIPSQGRHRWWLFVLVGPLLATIVVTILQIVLAFILHWPADPFAADAMGVLAPQGWEMAASVLIGSVITGTAVLIASRRAEFERFWILIFALPIIATLVILFVAAVLDRLAGYSDPCGPGLGIFSPAWFALFGPLLIGLVIAVVVTWIASASVNVNRFSLHAIYRNRLTRAFLGASRATRSPDAFSGFDEDDNPPMAKLWPANPDGSWPKRAVDKWRPFHVINIALNIVSTRHLSWQERKAESFTVSPLHCGSGCKAYRGTGEYGGRKGISLGTAMAISGAAASPNMGYHSSPAITFLLTMFNVRLGWWFGNPGIEGANTYRLPGPAFALRPLIDETFGLTTDENPYVYLSDGGHFENLGLYEMVRRRCRQIIVVDAGQDADYGFADLGNAVRKISNDLGVTIRFYGLDKLKKRPSEGIVGRDRPYHAIGEIDYPSADSVATEDFGVILYIKAGYHGIEGAGICAYANANPAFPHQSTIDQWFSESQFESYRSLGFEIADGIFNDVLKARRDRATIDLRDIFRTLRERAKDDYRTSAGGPRRQA